MIARTLITVIAVALGTVAMSADASAFRGGGNFGGGMGFRGGFGGGMAFPGAMRGGFAGRTAFLGSGSVMHPMMSAPGSARGIFDRHLHRFRHGRHLGEFRGHSGAPGLR